MESYPVEVEAHPTFQDGAFLEDQLYAYNVEQTGYDDGTYLTLWVKNQTGERLAGLHGWTWGGSCYIQDLWVHKDLRGHGYGTQLLHAAEQEARTRGCHQVSLSSFSFQAPDFYQKHGYAVFAILEDHPRNHRHYYLRKRLSSMQGLVMVSRIARLCDNGPTRSVEGSVAYLTHEAMRVEEDHMPKELFPSSFECDCGHQSDFSERTVRELKAMSQKKKVYLADSAPEEHIIVFHRGKLVEIQCPKQPQSPETRQSAPKSRSSKKRATTRGIPDEVKTNVAARVEHFNTTIMRNPQGAYVPRYKGKFLYLDRQDYGRLHPICRLEYTGEMEKWSFAIYKYSDERYDAEEWFFPGAEHINGTIEGAMKAGLEAYSD